MFQRRYPEWLARANAYSCRKKLGGDGHRNNEADVGRAEDVGASGNECTEVEVDDHVDISPHAASVLIVEGQVDCRPSVLLQSTWKQAAGDDTVQ